MDPYEFIKLPENQEEYQTSLLWVKETLALYKVEPELVTNENWATVHKSQRADWEHDDLQESIVGTVCLIANNRNWLLQIGHRTYHVRAVWLGTEHDWCCWSLSLVDTETSIWHSLDLRLLKECPQNI